MYIVSVLLIPVCGQLVQTTNVKSCTCPGVILTYECTVVGGLGGATTLRGRANFSDCYSTGDHGQEIILWHRLFDIGLSLIHI